jgi:ABC-2 type transport system permease protein
MAKKTVETPEQAGPERALKAIEVRPGGATAKDAWRNIRLIIAREYKGRITQRGFIIGSVVLVVLVAAAAFIPTITEYIASRSTAQTQVVVVNSAGTIGGLDAAALLSYISTNLNGPNPASPASYVVTGQSQADLGSLEDQVKNGELDILLAFARAANGDLTETYCTHSAANNDSNLPQIQTLAQQLAFLDRAQRLGLTSSQTSGLLAPPDLTVVHTQGQSTPPANQVIAGYVLAFAGGFLIYVSVSLYAIVVAAGVAEEKSNRVMEVLLNAATPLQLMVGKILGVGAACLTQMGCLVAVGIGALLIQAPLQAVLFGAKAGGFSQVLASISIPFYLLFLVYFLLDYFLYAAVFAGFGAMVSRQEELQSAVLAPRLLIIAGFIAVYLGAGLPNATLVRVLSYIPIFSPTLMLVRLALGTVAWWEFVLTIGLMLITILAAVFVAARLYRYGVLLYGQKPGLGQLLKMVRTK